MKFFDTHFHYYGGMTPEEYTAQFPAEHQFTLMAVGVGEEETGRAAAFAECVPDSFFATGIHPGEMDGFDMAANPLRKFYCHPKLKAVGEIGLDYFYGTDNGERQREVFEFFLNEALTLDLPAIIHCRDKNGAELAYEHCFEHLKPFADAGGRFVCHCFCGTPEWAERFLALGGYLGITGIVTFKNGENIRQVVPQIPFDRLFLETDAPYLAPVPHRGSENHPGYLPFVAAKTAELLQRPVEEVAEQTLLNGRKFFRL